LGLSCHYLGGDAAITLSNHLRRTAFFDLSILRLTEIKEFDLSNFSPSQETSVPLSLSSSLPDLFHLLKNALSSVVEVTAVENGELDSMLNVLRTSGYGFFSNAIAMLDLIFEVLAGKSLTFFAPTDLNFFTLGMTDTASNYINTLRCHVIPFRISLADHHRFPSGSYFPTMFNNHRATIRISRLRFMKASDNFTTVDRIRDC
jgi:hypothetical protein